MWNACIKAIEKAFANTNIHSVYLQNTLSTYNNTDNSNEKKSTFSQKRREYVVGENMHEGKMEHGLGAGHAKSMTRRRPLQRREADE